MIPEQFYSISWKCLSVTYGEFNTSKCCRKLTLDFATTVKIHCIEVFFSLLYNHALSGQIVFNMYYCLKTLISESFFYLVSVSEILYALSPTVRGTSSFGNKMSSLFQLVLCFNNTALAIIQFSLRSLTNKTKCSIMRIQSFLFQLKSNEPNWVKLQYK